MKIDERVSKTLLLANLICTILIISIHYNSVLYIELKQGYTLNFYFQDFLTNGLARVAVPFFSLVSGFFMVSKVRTIKGFMLTLQKKLKTICLPYIISSCIIYLCYSIISNLVSFIPSPTFNISSIIKDIFLQPISTQFWYLRDLILLILISPILFNLPKALNFLFGLVLFFLWLLNLQPMPVVAGWYLINIETLFFFWAGGTFFIYVLNAIDLFNPKKIFLVIITWIFINVLRVIYMPGIDVWYCTVELTLGLLLYKTSIIIGVLAVIALAKQLSFNKVAIILSSYTFFVYLFHLIPLETFKHGIKYIFGGAHMFYFNFPIAIFLSFLLAILTSRFLPSFYKILTGGR